MNSRYWPLVSGILLLLVSASCAPTSDGDPPAPTAARPEAANAPWLPAPASSWQWQLSGPLDLGIDAEIFNVDYETTTHTETDTLKRDGRRLICYLSAGTRENYRSDADKFPLPVLGDVMSEWPDEQWLDIRRTDILLPIMAARMDTCVAKGFDAVEPDNVDGYLNGTGFPLTARDQESYNRAIAELAHSRGLSVALKNDLDQIPDLVDDFDFAINEECIRYAECDRYKPFTDAGKAVLHVEYQGPLNFCAESEQKGLSSMLKPINLGSPRHSC